MNDFLNRLAAERQKTDHEKMWKDWSKAHVHDGFEIWDPSGSPEVTASIAAFLNMVPPGRFETGIFLTAPRYLHDCAQDVPGVLRTNDRFLCADNTPKEVRSLWQRHGASVKFVRAKRTYYEEGYRCVREHLVLEDGRVSGTEGLHFPSSVERLYDAMSQFIVAEKL